MSAQNKAIVRRYFEEGWNQRKPAIMDELIAIDAIDHDPANPGVSPGPKGQKELLAKYTSAFPDTKFTLGDLIGDGDLVAVRWTVRGTHRGELQGIAPTGRQVNLTGIMIARIANGKIAETWSNWDALGMLQQLGVAARAEGA
ncbi:MAG: hypothetical protein DMG59_08455 [Acidobacteria bacterium]|jgi:steroid delta-isomerase-like uncharacterized protein|nr:MAG: hypothetical protein DMG59_08455 [Acidobacteriota bacterium]